jgi:hypothetical protein
VVRRSETEGDSQQYDGSCMSERKLYRWVERFQEGLTSVADEHRSGRQCISVSGAKVARVDALIGDNRRISVDTVATMLNIALDLHMASSIRLSNIAVIQVGAETVYR